MKQLLFMLCTTILITGCSKEDDIQVYSEKQQKALNVFKGIFADYQYSNLGGNEILGDPDIIIFETQYTEPKELRVDDYIDGSKYVGEAHGECVYKKYVVNEYENIECYYKVAYDASALTLYRKSDKGQYHHCTLFIDSETEFRLFQNGIPLPYIFKKQ